MLFDRFVRQSDDVCQDGDNTLCLPEGTTNVSRSLVDCENGKCYLNYVEH